MNYEKKALGRFSLALGCVVTGVFFAVAALWLFSFLSLYCASFLTWRGWVNRKKGIRFRLEGEWWKKAKDGVEQDPFDPCCLKFGSTGHVHEEERCTRYRYERPKPITKDELARIEEAWNEIISHLRDPEYGEEA